MTVIKRPYVALVCMVTAESFAAEVERRASEGIMRNYLPAIHYSTTIDHLGRVHHSALLYAEQPQPEPLVRES